MDDIKLFAKKRKRIVNPHTDRENIQSGHSDGIWHWKMHHAKKEKQETIHDGRDRPTKPRKKNEDNQGKWNVQILMNIGDETSGDERNNVKSVALKNEKATRKKTV